MTAYSADLRTNDTATPPVRNKVNKHHGRLRWFEASITVPAGGYVAGDTITWGSLPLGARPIGHLGKVSFSAGTAAATLTLGDLASPTRYLAATAINAAGSATPSALDAGGAQFETSDASSAATNNCTLISALAGAGMPAGQVVTVRLPYVCD